MDYELEVCGLTPAFLAAYPEATYPEIERKPARPYSCLLLECYEDFFVCIPFRSHINHPHAYMFKNSRRAARTQSGLDYTKVSLIKNPDFFLVNGAIVDQDEFKEAAINMLRITQEVTDYIDKYRYHIDGSSPLHPREFQRRYQYSTLSYFHDIMSLEV